MAKRDKDQQRKKIDHDVSYRAVAMQGRTGGPTTVDVEGRSVDFVAATENPVPMWDWDHGVIDEVLLMKGCQMPASRQIPLLDTHSRYSTADVIGSARNLRTEKAELVATAVFSAAPRADEVFQKIQEGHITDASIGYRVHDSTTVPEGEKAVIAGRTWEGPVKVVTSWSLKELSVCPIGADEAAKARAEGQRVSVNTKRHTDNEGADAMNKKLRQRLEAMGLRKEATEDEAWEFWADKADAARAPGSADADSAAADVDALRRKDAAERARARKAELDRQRAISTECAKWEGKGFDLGDLEAELIRDGTTIEDSVRRIGDLVRSLLDKRDSNAVDFAGPITVSVDERDKFNQYAEAGLLVRAGYADKVDEKLRGGHDLVGMHLRDLMVKTARMSGCADLGFNARSMSSSDFPNILANVQNKILVDGYQAAEVTWRRWCRPATTSRVDNGTLPSVSFLSKARHIYMNDGAYEYLKFGDGAETYVMDKIGGLVHISEKTILNDNLMAISSQASALGDVIARGVNIKVYGDGTSEDPGTLVGAAGIGETMADTTALFTTGHANYVPSGSGAAPNVTTLGAAKSALRTQRDIGSNYPLNLRPGFLIVPAALESVAEQLLNSQFLVMAGTAAAVTTAGDRNPFYQSLELVVEPTLDGTGVAGATTRWYVASSRPEMNVWVIFHESTNDRPVIEQRAEWLNDGLTWKGNLKVATKAATHKGIYCNYGA